jgi:hypothetical protein
MVCSFLPRLSDMNHCFIVISHLSTGDHAVEEDVFQSTLRYIFTFIEKVRFNFLINYCYVTLFIGKTSGKHR